MEPAPRERSRHPRAGCFFREAAAIAGVGAFLAGCAGASAQRSTSNDGGTEDVASDAGTHALDGGDTQTLDGGDSSSPSLDATTPTGTDAGAITSDGEPADGADSGLGFPVYPEPSQTTGPGVLPPARASAVYTGTLIYDDPRIVRDLGFSGVVNGQIVWTFGDTLLLTEGGSTFTASDSAGLGDFHDPTHVHAMELTDGEPEKATEYQAIGFRLLWGALTSKS